MAQRKLYEAYKVYLFGVAMRYAKNKLEAEDILQEGFLKILKDIKSWTQAGPLEAWMRKIIVNTALMHIRKYRKLVFLDLEEQQFDIPDVTFEENERAEVIIKMIQSLPDPYQTIFNLKALDGYSYAEISEKLNIKEATLRSHYLRARNKLQDVLQKEF
ncbi:RNA polymerase sigma factor [Portibacter lacus]|uniref:HTH luxR-type domain-containing protein n=1 Tax=Portibacter lacus TaxID=1099794 RepID=A0AA37SWS2_9BACT|nr:RNA polymerase sigma factor [Portibacter lacus]GLR19278.1 hypothetical protein GCM10007940_38940 [Portibacter lacus]